ncbi:MAG: type II toxin-antitoxin system prevent-host-death family antitoxin [Kiloniellaceae bacterium]
MFAMTATRVRSTFAEVLGRVAHRKERIAVERRGRPIAALVSIEDLERLEGRRPAADDSQAWRRAQRLAKIGNWRRSIEGNELVSCSEDYARIHGVGPDEIYDLMKHRMERVIHPDDRDRVASEYRRADERGDDYEIEYRIVRPDGEIRHVLEIGEAAFDAAGRAVEHIGTVQDITERKRAEAALRASEARFRDLIEGSIEGILIHRDHRPLLVNETWAAIHGYSTEEVLAMDSVVPLMSPGDRERLVGYKDARLRGEAVPDRYEYRAVRKDGTSIWLENLVRAVEWDGEPAIQTVIIDITERKLAEEALRQARDELELRVEARTRDLEEVNQTLRLEIMERKRAEEALRESEERYRRLVDLSPDGVFVNCNGRFAFANPAAVRAFGAETAEDLIGREVLDFMHADFRDTVRQRVKIVLEGGVAPPMMEQVYVRLDGQSFDVETSATPITYRGERAVLSVFRDIAERKRSEEAIKEREAQLKHAQAMAKLGGFVWDDVSNRCLYCSEELAGLIGTTVEEIMATRATHDSLLSRIHPDDRARYQAVIEAANARVTPYDVEYRVHDDAGSLRYWREMGEPITDETGRLVRTFGTIQDITDIKRAEAALRESEERLRAVIENSPTAILLKDLEGRFRLVNGRFREWFANRAEDMVGRTSYDIRPRDQADALVAQDREVLDRLTVVEREHEVTFADGRRHTVVTTKFPVFDSSRSPIGVGSISMDVTEQRAAEERLRQAHRMEAVGQLTGGVAHDFNNLLGVVIGNAELLGDRLGQDDRHVQALLRAAARGAELTQRLLAFSRRQPLQPRALDLDALVTGMSDMLSRTLGETIEVEVSPRPGLWRAMADAGQIENALLNLAINARDAMPGGGKLSIETANVTLVANDSAARADLRPGEYVMASVRDTGCGIAPDVLDHVFEPFFTTKEVGQGSGLGLSMVYGFAQQSGGHVAIDSAPDRGTTVRLYLPRAAKEVAARPREEAAGAQPTAQGETVLVLEDDSAVRELAVAILEDLGYRVVTAPDGRAAVAALDQAAEIDLLLSDVVLPGGTSGPDVAEHAKRRRPGIKVLFMSGYAADSLVPNGPLDNGVALINKPFRKADLAHKVREVLDTA